MKLVLIIEADTNDADYITSEHEVTEEQLTALQPVFDAIKNCDADYNWFRMNNSSGELEPEDVYEGILTQEQIDMFDNYRPYSEDGIHTINSVKVFEIVNERKFI